MRYISITFYRVVLSKKALFCIAASAYCYFDWAHVLLENNDMHKINDRILNRLSFGRLV